jgi:hypothetical protein
MSARSGIVVPLIAAGVSLLAAASAQATVTQATVNSPADGTHLLQNLTTDPNETFSVSGTTNGTTGDEVDVRCYNGGTPIAAVFGPIPVAADGSFSSTGVLQANFQSQSCELVAVPTDTTPALGNNYSGPRVTFSEYETETVGGGGPNASDVEDLHFTDQQQTGATGVYSSGDCGPFQSLYDGTAAMSGGPALLSCAGTLYSEPAQYFANPGTVDSTRSEIEVDGQNAYGTYAASRLYPTNAGFPAQTDTLDSFDAATGAAQTTESENIVKCGPDDVYNPSSSQCSSFAPTGVKLTRVIDYSGDGRIATVTDTWSSTDGAAHNLDLQYETDLGATTAGWELPGESSFTQHTTGQTAAAPTSASGTIYTVYDSSTSPSLTNPVAAMTFASPYSSIHFDNTLWSAAPAEVSGLIDFQRTIPASGSTAISWTYATASSLSEAQSDAATAQTAYAASVAIGSPSNGALVTGSPVTVTGTASAPSGIHTVTVNGVAAAISGDNWTAPVPLTLGSPTTITATVTSDAGSTATSSETVTYAHAATAITGGAQKLSTTVATVTGTANPGGIAAHDYFQYGASNSYGQQTASGSLPAGASPVPVQAVLKGLHAFRTYHYRVVVVSSAGPAYGHDRTFTTIGIPRGLALTVNPGHDATAPYKYRASGSLRLPAGMSKPSGCHGQVTIVVKHGSKKLATLHPHVGSGCGYAASLKLSAAKLHGHGKLTFTARYGGDAVLTPVAARPKSVRFGQA